MQPKPDRMIAVGNLAAHIDPEGLPAQAARASWLPRHTEGK